MLYFEAYKKSYLWGEAMSHVKTAISIHQSLLAEAEALARKMQVPRSKLFAMAVEEFLRQHNNQLLLEQLNTAYKDAPKTRERTILARMKHKHRHQVENQW